VHATLLPPRRVACAFGCEPRPPPCASRGGWSQRPGVGTYTRRSTRECSNAGAHTGRDMAWRLPKTNTRGGAARACCLSDLRLRGHGAAANADGVGRVSGLDLGADVLRVFKWSGHAAHGQTQRKRRCWQPWSALPGRGRSSHATHGTARRGVGASRAEATPVTLTTSAYAPPATPRASEASLDCAPRRHTKQGGRWRVVGSVFGQAQKRVDASLCRVHTLSARCAGSRGGRW